MEKGTERKESIFGGFIHISGVWAKIVESSLSLPFSFTNFFFALSFVKNSSEWIRQTTSCCFCLTSLESRLPDELKCLNRFIKKYLFLESNVRFNETVIFQYPVPWCKYRLSNNFFGGSGTNYTMRENINFLGTLKSFKVENQGIKI